MLRAAQLVRLAAARSNQISGGLSALASETETLASRTWSCTPGFACREYSTGPGDKSGRPSSSASASDSADVDGEDDAWGKAILDGAWTGGRELRLWLARRFHRRLMSVCAHTVLRR